MKIKHLPLLFSLAALGASHSAFALTTAGTDVNNTATISFSVSGTPQTDESSNTTTFAVDRKIDLTVTPPGANVPVVSLATGKTLTYTFANTGNSPQDFSFAVTNLAGDGFDTASCVTPANLTDVAPGAPAVNVDVVCVMPDSLSDGDLANIVLTATALEPTTVVTVDGHTVSGVSGAALTNDAGAADDVTNVDTVFADGAGATDAGTDAKHSAQGTYEVQTATLTAVKTSAISGASTYNQRIPGARITYSIVVSNAGSVSATGVNIQDVAPANTTYVAGTAAIAVTGAGAGTVDDTGGTITTSATIPAGESATLTFDVTID